MDRTYQDKAKAIVVAYFNAHAKEAGDFVLTEDQVFIVWFCKTLQNWKALLGTTLPADNRYYELTYDGNRKATYVDVYGKLNNVVVYDTIIFPRKETGEMASKNSDSEGGYSVGTRTEGPHSPTGWFVTRESTVNTNEQAPPRGTGPGYGEHTSSKKAG